MFYIYTDSNGRVQAVIDSNGGLEMGDACALSPEEWEQRDASKLRQCPLCDEKFDLDCIDRAHLNERPDLCQGCYLDIQDALDEDKAKAQRKGARKSASGPGPERVK
jgi:hypothetical protein